MHQEENWKKKITISFGFRFFKRLCKAIEPCQCVYEKYNTTKNSKYFGSILSCGERSIAAANRNRGWQRRARERRHQLLRFEWIRQINNKLLAPLRWGNSVCNRALSAVNIGVLVQLCAYKQSSKGISKVCNCTRL
jgi:hypothetical protein